MQKTNHTLHVGCHLSSASGYLAMGKAAVNLDANVFAFFTRNPRGGRAKPLDLDDVRAFCSYREEHGIGTLVAHAPYTMNACAAKDTLRAFAREAMADDLARLEHIPNTLYNFHPGSHVQQGAEKGIELIADLLNDVLDPAQKTIVLLETMAGKGTEVGRSFEEIAAIIERVDCKERLGVCLDTCHVWDAGYDIANDLDGVLEEFDRVIGLSRPSQRQPQRPRRPQGSSRTHRRGRNRTRSPDARHPSPEDSPFAFHLGNTERRCRICKRDCHAQGAL